MIRTVYTPQLQLLHRGKVRDSFRIDARRRLLVVTDRISAFDQQLEPTIPGKGEILNRLAAYWFEQTKHIVPNHMIAVVDAQAMLVHEAEPVRLEVVVRGFIAGSMWRSYEAGAREYCGIALPDGLTENARLAAPIVTPTTKEASDRPMSRADLVAAGFVTDPLFELMQIAALKLFALGSTQAEQRGLLLADTKYEFGLIDGELHLIDEIHTPDSSRFWDAVSYRENPARVASYDKEFVRSWMKTHQVNGALPLALPEDVVAGTAARYQELMQRFVGADARPVAAHEPSQQRLCRNLVNAGLIHDAYVAIVMGSKADLEFSKSIQSVLRAYGVYVDLRILSAHKNGERIAIEAEQYNQSIEPGSVIAIAGESNGLGGALAASLNLPVINCPPFKSETDYSINVHSSLRMPSNVPAATVVKPELAALAALRSLNVRRLRDRFSLDIARMKEALSKDDANLRAAGYAAPILASAGQRASL